MNKKVSIRFVCDDKDLGVFNSIFEDIDENTTVDCLEECIDKYCFFDYDKWDEWNIHDIDTFEFYFNNVPLKDNDKVKDIHGVITCVINNNAAPL